MFGAVLYIAQDTVSPGHGAALSGDALAVVVALGAACYLVAFKACFAGMTAREFLDFQACRGALAVGAIVFIAVHLVQKGGGEGGLSNRSFEGENHLSKKRPLSLSRRPVLQICRASTRLAFEITGLWNFGWIFSH